MNSIPKFFNWTHLFAIPHSMLYDTWLLYFSLTMIVLPVVLIIFFRVRNRAKVYQKFDQLWGWGYSLLGLAGLFEWFSVTQALPGFGTRLAVYVWTLLIIGFTVFVVSYFKAKTTKEIVAFHEKKRKERYLNR